MVTSGTGRFHIEGYDLDYPTRFRDGSSMMALFAVPLTSAKALIADSGFAPAHLLPGRAVFSLNCVHYTDTDCGAYEEVAFAILVGRPGLLDVPASAKIPDLGALRELIRGTIGAHSWRLAVSTKLSRDCGIQMWGYPKVLGDLTWRRAGGRATMTWVHDGRLVMRFGMRDVGSRAPREISPPVYSVLDGQPVVGNLTQRYSGVGYHLRGTRLELGSQQFSGELRSLGLPRRPLVAVWNEHLDFEMGAPRPLTSGDSSAVPAR